MATTIQPNQIRYGKVYELSSAGHERLSELLNSTGVRSMKKEGDCRLYFMNRKGDAVIRINRKMGSLELSDNISVEHKSFIEYIVKQTMGADD